MPTNEIDSFPKSISTIEDIIRDPNTIDFKDHNVYNVSESATFTGDKTITGNLSSQINTFNSSFRMGETTDYGVTGTTIIVDHTGGNDNLPYKDYYNSASNRFATANAAADWVNRSGESYVIVQVLNTSAGSRHVLTRDLVFKGKTSVTFIGLTFANPLYLDCGLFRIIAAKTRLSLGRINGIFGAGTPIISIDNGIIEMLASTWTYPAIPGIGFLWATNGVFHIGDRVTINFSENNQSLFDPKGNYGGKCVFNTHALAPPTFNTGAYTGLLWVSASRSFETFFSNGIALTVPSNLSLINGIYWYNKNLALNQTVYDNNCYNHPLSIGGSEPIIFNDLNSASPDGDYTSYKLLATNEDGKLIPVTGGVNGLSAYEVAVNNGFVGNEVAWLASLEGATGPAGTTDVTEIEIDFGVNPVRSKRFTITDVAITETSKVLVNPSGNIATGRGIDDWEWDSIQFAAKSNSGNFLLYAKASGGIGGKRKIFYTVN